MSTPKTKLCNRYNLGRQIGRGGMAYVFEARDAWRGEAPVAVKVATDKSQSAASALGSEFGLLYTLRHPHLPEVHYFGRTPAHFAIEPSLSCRAFLVEELLVGADARAWAEHQTPESVAALAARVAAALATLHAHGDLHGDVKPENILVTGPGSNVKLIDLNLASSDVSRGVCGTLRYMAPEALRGQRLAASDIYSLGATLAELLSGEPLTGNPGQQIHAPRLTDVIAAMTDPAAERRPDAVAVFELLMAEVEESEAHDLEALHDSARVSTGLLGQPKLENALRDLLAQEHTGARVLRIVGPAGAGKSAALRHAVARAATTGLPVNQGVVDASAGRIEDLMPLLSGLGVETDEGYEEADATLVPETRWRRFAGLAERLTRSEAEEPVVVALDDVPAGSPLDGMGGFLERLGGSGPKVVWVQAGTASDAERVIELEQLGETSMEELLLRARPLRRIDSTAAATICRKTGGNPQLAWTLVAAEPGDALLRAAQNDDLCSNSLAELVSRRLSRHPEEIRRLLSAIALLEPPAPVKLLQACTDVRDGLAEDLLSHALRDGLVSKTDAPGGPALSILGDAVRRIYAERAPEALLTQLAQALEQSQWRDERAVDLGRLWYRLGRHQKAARHLLEAARKCTRELRFAEASELLKTLTEDTAELPNDVRHAAILDKARLEISSGRAPAALETLARAEMDSQTTRLRAEALIACGRYAEAAEIVSGDGSREDPELQALHARALLLAGFHAAATKSARQALGRAPDHPHNADLTCTLGLAALYTGHADEALELMQRAGERARKHRDETSTERIRANEALVRHKLGDFDGAETAYLQSLSEARARHDLPRQLLRLTNLSTLRQERGQFADALSGYEEASHLAQLIEGHREQVRIGINRANLLCWLGQPAAAREVLGPALALADRHQMTTEGIYLELVRAEVALAEGERDDARAALERTSIKLATTEDSAAHAELDSMRAQLALHARRAREARSLARSAAKRARAARRPRIEAKAQLWEALAELEEPSDAPQAALRASLQAANKSLSREDYDVAWMAHAAAARLHSRSGRQRDAEHHMREARRLAGVLRDQLSAQQERSYTSLWYRRDLWSLVWSASNESSSQPGRDIDRLLAINRELAQDHDPERLLERIIDAAIALSGAERGFILLASELTDQEPDIRIRAARNLDRESLASDAIRVSCSIARRAMESGYAVSSLDALEDERFRGVMSVHEMRLRSVLCLPLRSSDETLGALYLDNRYRPNAFSEADVALLTAFGDQAAIALANARFVAELDERSRDLERSRAQIDELNQRLQRELAVQAEELAAVRRQQGDATDDVGRHGMIGTASKLQQIYRIIDRVADKEVPVTILGESGTGKELVARAIHAASPRCEQPFVCINCGAIPGELLESELFGHEQGAFTGAVRTKPGLFEVAAAGTVFLDEIGEMPLAMQVKLLRVLQQKELRRVGGTATLKAAARVVSASNKDLDAMVRAGQFREDLWYRLNVVEVAMPPLRQRREDIPLLVNHFVGRYRGRSKVKMSREALALLLDYAWPGNVRELENEIQRALALADGRIGPQDLSTKVRGAEARPQVGPRGSLKEAVEQFERETIRVALAEHGGKVAKAAESLGLTRAGLYKKINKYGMSVDKS